MEYIALNNNIEISGINDFNLEDTFNCGQCFRWNQLDDGSFGGVVYGKYLNICQYQEKIVLKDCTKDDFENIWKEYLDLNCDYDLIKKRLRKLHPNLKVACDYAPGIKILKQEPWEALCSFIISQNNNIPRIKGIIERLCKNFGNEINNNNFSFPSAKVISHLSEDDLKIIKVGFRARYILDAAKKVTANEIDFAKIRNMPLDNAKKELAKITGVGPKVAECTLLYGLYRTDAFPIDTWIKKAMPVMFPNIEPKDFGEYAGIAQQYIFHYSRMNSEIF